MSPFIIRRRVDFPDPLAPHSTTVSPGSITRSTPSIVGFSAVAYCQAA